MKVVTLQTVKYKGNFYLPGNEVDVSKQVADDLISKGLVEMIQPIAKKGEQHELNTDQ